MQLKLCEPGGRGLSKYRTGKIRLLRQKQLPRNNLQQKSYWERREEKLEQKRQMLKSKSMPKNWEAHGRLGKNLETSDICLVLS